MGRILDADGEGGGLALEGVGGLGQGAGVGMGRGGGGRRRGRDRGIRWRRRLRLYSEIVQLEAGHPDMKEHVVSAYCEGVRLWVRFAERAGASEEDTSDLLRGSNWVLGELEELV